MTINLNNYYKFKESDNYIVYLEKEEFAHKVTRQMIVYYKARGTYMQCIMNQALLDLLFNPNKFKDAYMKVKSDKQK